MGRVTRRDPEKKIKDTPPVFGGTVVGTIPPTSIGGGTPTDGKIPVVDENGDVQWVLITQIFQQLGMALRNEPVISLGDPEDPLNPQFVFSETGDIITAGTPFN
jgi:hypothetical protein